MLDSLTIRNFRLFEELTIERLGRVNLIVGKNNSGKSCLLEAVELYVGNFTSGSILSVLDRRNEYVRTKTARRDRAGARHIFEQHPIRNLFTRSKEPHRIEIANNGSVVSAGIAYFDDSNPRRLERIGETPEVSRKNRPFLEVDISEQQISQLPLIPLDTELADTLLNTPLSLISKPTYCVSHDGLDEFNCGQLWNEIALQPGESIVKQSIKAAFSEIENIAVVHDPEAIDYVVKTKLTDGAVVNIRSLGDGVRRLFGILLCAVNARDGYLLIDEIENGLHWSIHEQMWRMLFSIASDMNIQIFATTHSEDTVSAFESAWRAHESAGAFHRLERHPKSGKIVASTYLLETLSASIDTDSEVR